MSRTTKEIFNQLVDEKNKRLELVEINSKSKVSVMNGLLWVVAAGIKSFEAVMDAFIIDISSHLENRVNGTPSYYANALLSYQHGDDLIIKDNGTSFGYSNVDESKRIITKVAYSELELDTQRDNRILYKVATGRQGELKPITDEQLIAVKAYLNKIKFAGVDIDVTSKKGDILIPRLTVYHTGQLTDTEMFGLIEEKLHNFISQLTFDARVRKIDIIEAIKSTNYVTDVYIDKNMEPEGGIFIAKYNDDGELQDEVELDRVMDLASGYLTESSKVGDEEKVPSFRDSLTLKVER